MADRIDRCPACAGNDLEVFHVQSGVPANSCLLLPDAEEASGFPRGNVWLGFCGTCGFISNMVFDPTLAEYSARYEETQAYSARFVEFARDLAKTWVDKYQLAGGTVVEIGCGKGEFLVLMAEAGVARGIGIDPGVDPDRIAAPAGVEMEWRREFFGADFGPLDVDAVVCRHTLEHISPVADFLTTIRSAIGDRMDTVVLFELPDVQRILDEAAFWDVYYEHCSYFSAGSLVRLFARCGFDVLDVERVYDDQYLIIEAWPGSSPPSLRRTIDDMSRLRRSANHFRVEYGLLVQRWNRRIAAVRRSGRQVVIWGAGSKGVAFLSAIDEEVAAAVDINPHKHGMYMAGTGHRIIAPEELPSIDPALVIAMNPIYVDEIGRELQRLGLDADLMSV